jgi:hypothetical protein
MEDGQVSTHSPDMIKCALIGMTVRKGILVRLLGRALRSLAGVNGLGSRRWWGLRVRGSAGLGGPA